MMVDRRQFIAGASMATASMAVPGWAAPQTPRQPLKILLLGGTRFIGIPITELAQQRGHTVTFFNRGRTNTELFPNVERITGDRAGPLDGLKDRQWDAVIDTSAYVPRAVKTAADVLAPNVGQYLFVSSISVYPTFSEPRTEQSAVGTLKDPTVEKVDGETYGPLKALCEQAAHAAMPGRVTVLRPGLIVGPHDSTDRFTYWPARAARGGDLLAPGSPKDRIQIIDARDLAAFALDTIERRVYGTFNLVSPPGMFTMGDVVSESIRAARSLAKPSPPPRAVWGNAAFLEKQKVEGWTDMPVWLNAQGNEAAFAATSSALALKEGLKITPLRKTVTDTLEWHLKRPEAERTKLKAGMDPQREQEVLQALRA